MKQIVVLASEPVGGRSRATELPCFAVYFNIGVNCKNTLLYSSYIC